MDYPEHSKENSEAREPVLTPPEPTTRMSIPQHWTFKDSSVAEHFDSHVREQLPWYELATKAMAFIAREFIRKDGVVLDLGCSTGNVGIAIQDTLVARNATIIPVDSSSEILEYYAGPGRPECANLEDWEAPPHSLAILFLTLQFIHPSKRERFIAKLLEKTESGGAIILVDRFYPSSHVPRVNTLLHRLTLHAKQLSNTPLDEIMEKELSLVGTQFPLQDFELNSTTATTFFSYGHFKGVVIPK